MPIGNYISHFSAAFLFFMCPGTWYNKDGSEGGIGLEHMQSIHKMVKYAILLIILGLMVFFLFFTETGDILLHSNVNQISAYMGSYGTLSVFFGMLAVFGQTLFPYLPFVVVAGANVLMFGLFWGFAINYSMSILGALASFLFARYLARDWVDLRLQKYPQLSIFKQNIEKNGFFYILIGRFIPVLPSTIINWGSGLSRLSWGPFIMATMIGKLPMVFLESLIGHDLLHFKENKGRLLLLIVIFLLLVGLGSWMKKKTVRNQNQ